VDLVLLEQVRRRNAALPEDSRVLLFMTAKERNAVFRLTRDLVEAAERNPEVAAQLDKLLEGLEP
jgi:hypothetical protein